MRFISCRSTTLPRQALVYETSSYSAALRRAVASRCRSDRSFVFMGAALSLKVCDLRHRKKRPRIDLHNRGNRINAPAASGLLAREHLER